MKTGGSEDGLNQEEVPTKIQPPYAGGCGRQEEGWGGNAHAFQSGSWPRRSGLPTTMSKALARVTATLNLWKGKK